MKENNDENRRIKENIVAKVVEFKILGGRNMEAYKCMKIVGTYILMIALIVFIGYGISMPDAGEEYKSNGIRTEATITSMRGFRTKLYWGVYRDSYGNLIEAEIIPNKSGVMVGDVVEGYILKDEPYKVWCDPGKGLNLFLKAILWFFEILFVWAIVFVTVGLIKEKREERARNKAIWEEGMREFREENRWRNNEQI